jgi:hypothetical protein
MDHPPQGDPLRQASDPVWHNDGAAAEREMRCPLSWRPMPDNPSARSVKIGADERTGWSSERPRAQSGPPRPPDISGRCRVLRPSYRMRYSPGSLVVIVGAEATAPAKFAERVIEERGVVLAPERVRALLAGKVAAEEIDERARELLRTAVTKRLQERQSVVVPLDGFDRDEREALARIAHGLRRGRHLVLLDAGREESTDEERPALDELRNQLDSGGLGQEGFETAMRLSAAARAELKRIVFAPPPRDD